MTNPAGAAVVNAVGPIRQLVRGEDKNPRRYLVILPGTPDNHGAAVQVQRQIAKPHKRSVSFFPRRLSLAPTR